MVKTSYQDRMKTTYRETSPGEQLLLVSTILIFLAGFGVAIVIEMGIDKTVSTTDTLWHKAKKWYRATFVEGEML